MDQARQGLSPRSTLELAEAALASGDEHALSLVTAVLDHASPVVTWPEVIDRRTRGGSFGRGHDPAATASLCSFVRTMLVREPEIDSDPRSLHLLNVCNVVPHGWLGQAWELHDLPTALGTFGFAVRWHGDRPALLWQLDPHEEVTDVSVRAPGLDPNWSATGFDGEALLAPVAPPQDRQPPAAAGGAGASSSFT